MSQSRFSIVLVGVSALLRRPLVSRLRPADSERSPWVVFAARGCRFDSGFRSASWFFRLPLRRLPSAGWFFRLPFWRLPSAGWFFRLPLRRFRSAGWPSGSLLPLFGTHRFGNCPRRVGLRTRRFRFSARTDPHRRAAEARTDGAQRHDNCFTSKHLSQHVNLPHRTP